MGLEKQSPHWENPEKFIRRCCLTQILLSFQLGNQVIIFYPGRSTYLYIQVMTLIHAQVLALWVKLNPSKNSAGPVLDPKMDNNEHPCRFPWVRHRQQTLLSPAQHKEPTLQFYKGRSPKPCRCIWLRCFCCCMIKWVWKSWLFFMLSGPNIN